jgi:hypothetical protein
MVLTVLTQHFRLFYASAGVAEAVESMAVVRLTAIPEGRAAVAVRFWARLVPVGLELLDKVSLVGPTTLGLALLPGAVALVVVLAAQGKLATPLRNLVV